MMTTFKRILAAAVLVTALHGETVYFSARGKDFHKDEKCISLARSKGLLHAERKQAEEHGLKPCGICYREKKAGKAERNGWAQKGGAK